MMRKTYKIPLITSCLGISLALLFTHLTFIPSSVFAEVVSPETRTLADITKMQEMNKVICDNTKDTETQYQLVDIRDGKTYYVAKLADEQCWMTQNLDLDLYENNEGITLTTEDSDVTSDLEVVSSGASSGQIAIDKVTEPSGWPSSGDTYKGYYDPGDYVYTYNSGASNENDRYKSVGSNTTCTKITTTSDLKGTKCNNYLTEITEENSSSLDMHYHIGNYYSWPAAALGSGDSLNAAGQKAEQSICPKGWKLPLSYSTNNPTPGSFNNLLSKYNVQSSPLSGNNAIYKKPLYFVYGGYLDSGNLNFAAYIGRYWSSIASSPDGGNSIARAYNLAFTDTVSPSGTYYRYVGLSVRCVNNPETDSSEDLSQPDIPPVSGNASISVTVSPVISIDAVAGMVEDEEGKAFTVDFTTQANGNIKVDVSSNKAYQVLLSAEETRLIPVLTNEDSTEEEKQAALETLASLLSSGQYIPMMNTTDPLNPIKIGTSAWGVKKTVSTPAEGNPTGGTYDDITPADTYSPVGIGKDNGIVFYQSSRAEKQTLIFPVAITVDAKLLSGTYATNVTVTALANS